MKSKTKEILFLCVISIIMFFAVSYIASFLFAGFFLNDSNGQGVFGLTRGETGQLLVNLVGFGAAGFMFIYRLHHIVKN
ncbi:MAG: hypothetical protein V4678_01935 [Patescibacteria group bacterium]